MPDRYEKIQLAKKHIAEKIGDIIERNYDEMTGALETAGTFTALLEAYKAAEIAEQYEKPSAQASSEGLPV